MGQRWGDSKQDRDALDKHITREDEIQEDLDALDEQLRWIHGTLSTRTLERILADVLLDLWHDCYRRDTEMGVRYRMFCEKVVSGLYAATGTQFRVE